jgi:hypothetical protein
MSSRFEDGVRDDDEPACNSNDDEFVRLSTFFETFGDRHQHLIVRGCGERSLEQHLSQRPPPSDDCSSTTPCSAIVRHRSKAGHGRSSCPQCS